MKLFKYILVNPSDDSGNDDGVLDRREMTEEESCIRNEEYEVKQFNRRWIKVEGVKTKEIYHAPDKRKADQHWEMAGLARMDGDRADEKKHTDMARKYGSGWIEIIIQD